MKSNLLSRGFMVAASFAAVFAMLACSVSMESETTQETRSLLARLPSGSTAIGWIDVEAIAAAVPPERWAEYQSVVENEEDWQDVERFAEATGLDPRSDLRQIAIAVMPNDEDDVDALVLISATFDGPRIASFLGQAESETYEGHTIYRLDEEVWAEIAQETEAEDEEHAEEGGMEMEMEEDDPPFVVVLDSQTLLFGDEAGVRLGIDTEEGIRDSLNMDPHMNDLVRDVAGDGQVWFVATREAWQNELDEIPAGTPVPTNAIQSIETVTMSMLFGDGMAMRLAAVAATAEDAEQLATAVNGLVAMGKMMLQNQQPGLYEILDRGISVGSDEQTFSIDATLSEEDIDTLRAIADERGSQMQDERN